MIIIGISYNKLVLKKSKKGRLELLYDEVTNCYFTVCDKDITTNNHHRVLRTIFKDGELLIDDTLANIRHRAGTI